MNARCLIIGLTLFIASLIPPASRAAQGGSASLKSLDETVAALPRADASGQVVDKAGVPVAGADIFLYYEAGMLGFRDRLAGRVKTDAEGKFTFGKAIVWEPVISLSSSSRLPKYDVIARDEKLGIAFTVILRGDPADNLKITMTKQDFVDVGVADSAGKPIEDAQVYLADGSRPGRPEGAKYELWNFRLTQDIGLSSGRTGPDGKVKMLATPGGQFWAVKDGYARGWQRKMILFPSARISGRVTDPAGRPVAGIPVWFNYNGKSLGYDDFAVTGPDGRYILKNLPGAGFRYSWMKPADEEGAPGDVTLAAQDARQGSSLIGKGLQFQLKPGENLTKDLALVPGVVLAGQVVNESTGKPVPGLPLTRTAEDGSRYLKNMTTDEQGRFRALFPPGTDVQVFWDNPRDGATIQDSEQTNRQAWQGMLNADKTDLMLMARLWDVGPLEGVVIDFDGRPSPISHSVYLHSDVPVVKTGPNGRFTLKAAPRDRDFDLFVIGPSKIGGALVHCKAGTTSVTMRTQHLRDYPGIVTNLDGSPAAGLKFYLDLKLNGTTIYNVRQEPQTDAKGMFVAKGLLPTATYYAWWSSDNEQNRDYDDGNATLDLASRNPDEPLAFQARQFLNSLMGKVVDAQGKPIADAQVSVQTGGMQPGNVDRNTSIKTNKNGEFTIERLAPGKVAIKVTHPGHKTRQIVTDSDSIDCEVKLGPSSPMSEIRFIVVDEQDTPVPGATIKILTKGLLGSASREVTTPTLTLKTDAGGIANYYMPGSIFGMIKAPRVGTFCCDAPGFDLAFDRLNAEADAEILVCLTRSGENFAGQVVDDQNRPVPGAEVRLAGWGAKGTSSVQHYEEEMGVKALTDGDGRFTLPRINKACNLALGITAKGYAKSTPVIFANNQAQPRYKLSRPGAIVGKVVYADSGKPAASGQVSGFCTTGAQDSSSAKIAADGTFKLEGLNPGSYLLRFTPSGFGSADYRLASEPTLTVEAGKTTTATLELVKPIPVRGKLVDPKTGKAPAKGCTLLLRREGMNGFEQNMPVKPDGTWEFHLMPGTYVFSYALAGSGRITTSPSKPLAIESGKTYDQIVIEIR